MSSLALKIKYSAWIQCKTVAFYSNKYHFFFCAHKRLKCHSWYKSIKWLFSFLETGPRELQAASEKCSRRGPGRLWIENTVKKWPIVRFGCTLQKNKGKISPKTINCTKLARVTFNQKSTRVNILWKKKFVNFLKLNYKIFFIFTFYPG